MQNLKDTKGCMMKTVLSILFQSLSFPPYRWLVVFISLTIFPEILYTSPGNWHIYSYLFQNYIVTYCLHHLPTNPSWRLVHTSILRASLYIFFAQLCWHVHGSKSSMVFHLCMNHNLLNWCLITGHLFAILLFKVIVQ